LGGDGGSVYLCGGEHALSAAVEDEARIESGLA
jgi:hypothetical protein